MAKKASSGDRSRGSGSSGRSRNKMGKQRPGFGTEHKERRLQLKALTVGKGVDSGRSKQRLPNEWEGRIGLSELVEPPLDPQELADLLLVSTDFATVVGQIADDVAGLGWHLTETKKGARATQAQRDEDKAKIERFLEDAPGGEEDETLRDVLQRTILDWEATGNGYIEISRDGKGKADGLYHIPSVRVRVRRDREGFGQIGSTDRALVWFRRFGKDPELGLDWGDPKAPATEAHNEMLHLRHYHPASYWYGIPRVVPAIGAIRGNQFASDRNIKFFYNKALPEIALVVEGDTESVNEEDMQKFAQTIKDHFMTELMGEHFKPLLIELPNGLRFRVEKLSPEVKDADHRQYRIDNRDEVLRAYSMMPNRVGVIETASLGGGTGQSQIEIYKNSVVKPRQEVLEKKLTGIIRVGLGIETWTFKFDEIDTIDEAREATIANILGTLAWMTINEGREYASKFLKVELPQIDEEWANYPFPILAPQLQVMDLGIGAMSPMQSDEAVPGHELRHFGVEVGPGLPDVSAPMRMRMVLDRAYGNLYRKIRGDSGGDGSGRS